MKTLFEELSRLGFSLEEEKQPKLNKPFRTPGGPKKFSVYVKNPKGNVVKVNFGDPNMEIKRDDPERRKNFRARHGCDDPGPKHKARYWSCRFWSTPSVTQLLSQSLDHFGIPLIEQKKEDILFSEKDFLQMLDSIFIETIEGGKGEGRKPSDFQLDQVLKGLDIEFEHTKDVIKSLEIVIDHLSERDDYYSMLSKAEKI